MNRFRLSDDIDNQSLDEMGGGVKLLLGVLIGLVVFLGLMWFHVTYGDRPKIKSCTKECLFSCSVNSINDADRLGYCSSLCRSLYPSLLKKNHP
jgi:hypothetical protein